MNDFTTTYLATEPDGTVDMQVTRGRTSYCITVDNDGFINVVHLPPSGATFLYIRDLDGSIAYGYAGAPLNDLPCAPDHIAELLAHITA